MEVYKYNKCLLDRLEESMLVLPWKEEIIPASQVREQWSCFIELQIEPAGWQAIWNIPRVICEAFNLRYPTTVFGHVEQVLFRELRAIFVVEAVQDEDVNFMERHEVALEELWPTITQENNALNVEQTAECLDRLRFFYTNVWMPWDNDNDDDLNWVEKHLESRIHFCYSLRHGSINRTLTQHIRSLLNEAKYIQQRREYLELGLSEDEADEVNTSTLETAQVTDLMRLHLRLSMIRNEIEIYENPELRCIHEEVHLSTNDKNSTKKQCFIVTQPSFIERQLELLNMVKEKIAKDCLVQLTKDLLTALNDSNPRDMIFLAPGKHELKFLEYFSGEGYMAGITQSDSKEESIIKSPNDDSMLLIFNGNYILENLVLDCSNVRTGLLVKGGEIVLRNCRLIGDNKSSTQQGIVCSVKAQIKLENCIVEKFASGIVLHKDSQMLLQNTKIIDCIIGLESSTQCTNVNIIKTVFIKSKKCGIFVDNLELEDVETKQKSLKSFDDLKRYTFWSGNCEFEQCKSNISVTNQKMALVAAESMSLIVENDGDEKDWNECTSPVTKCLRRELFTNK